MERFGRCRPPLNRAPQSQRRLRRRLLRSRRSKRLRQRVRVRFRKAIGALRKHRPRTRHRSSRPQPVAERHPRPSGRTRYSRDARNGARSRSSNRRLHQLPRTSDRLGRRLDRPLRRPRRLFSARSSEEVTHPGRESRCLKARSADQQRDDREIFSWPSSGIREARLSPCLARRERFPRRSRPRTRCRESRRRRPERTRPARLLHQVAARRGRSSRHCTGKKIPEQLFSERKLVRDGCSRYLYRRFEQRHRPRLALHLRHPRAAGFLRTALPARNLSHQR